MSPSTLYVMRVLLGGEEDVGCRAAWVMLLGKGESSTDQTPNGGFNGAVTVLS